MCIEVFPVLSEQDCWKTRDDTWLGACSISVILPVEKLASRITSSFLPGSSRWASVRRRSPSCLALGSTVRGMCVSSIPDHSWDWCISVKAWFTWCDYRLKRWICSGLLKSFFRDKCLKQNFSDGLWSTYSQDINLCLHCWDALSLVKKFH